MLWFDTVVFPQHMVVKIQNSVFVAVFSATNEVGINENISVGCKCEFRVVYGLDLLLVINNSKISIFHRNPLLKESLMEKCWAL